MSNQTSKTILESIKIEDIDMNKCYFNPGCAMNIYKPYAGDEILKILNQYFGIVKMHSICCHHNPQLPQGSTIINNCAGCDKRFRSLYEGIQTISIWEILDSIENLSLPNYLDLEVSVQDSCAYRPKPQVHNAVRSLLEKMNIRVIDSEFSKIKSICCGDSYYPILPIEEIHKKQKERAMQMPCEDVVVYCVSCIKSMTIGGKTAHHMLDLLLNQKTEPQELNIEIYHDDLDKYIEVH